jgi:hypothetical protein
MIMIVMIVALNLDKLPNEHLYIGIERERERERPRENFHVPFLISQPVN